MTNYYLDVETFSPGERPNFETDSIITIQFQEIDDMGKPKEELKILKAWESSEKEILEEFTKLFKKKNIFDFIPVGYNLDFEQKMLLSRTLANNLGPFDLFAKDRPTLDLWPLGILMNKGQRKGSGLDRLTGKPHDGSIIPKWYAQKEYSKIDNYIRVEAREFLIFLQWCSKELSVCLQKFQQENNIKKDEIII